MRPRNGRQGVALVLAVGGWTAEIIDGEAEIMGEMEDDEPLVFYDSDEYRACETLAEQSTPIETAISLLIDFYGMTRSEARIYYERALGERGKGG